MVTENLTQAQIERYVSEFMLELGVPAHLRGYYYPVSYTHLDVYKRQRICRPLSAWAVRNLKTESRILC